MNIVLKHHHRCIHQNSSCGCSYIGLIRRCIILGVFLHCSYIVQFNNIDTVLPNYYNLFNPQLENMNHAFSAGEHTPFGECMPSRLPKMGIRLYRLSCTIEPDGGGHLWWRQECWGCLCLMVAAVAQQYCLLVHVDLCSLAGGDTGWYYSITGEFLILNGDAGAWGCFWCYLWWLLVAAAVWWRLRLQMLASTSWCLRHSTIAGVSKLYEFGVLASVGLPT